jgi:hypothetical protein
VAALPVGVVGDEVVDADLLEALAVARVFAKREPVLLELGLDEELERPLAQGACFLLIGNGRQQRLPSRRPFINSARKVGSIASGD